MCVNMQGNKQTKNIDFIASTCLRQHFEKWNCIFIAALFTIASTPGPSALRSGGVGGIKTLSSSLSPGGSFSFDVLAVLSNYVIQSLSRVRLFATPWIAACQVSLSFTVSRNLLKLMAIESVMTSNHLILCCPLLLLPSIFPSISIFSNMLVLRIRWPKYWSFSFKLSTWNY